MIQGNAKSSFRRFCMPALCALLGLLLGFLMDYHHGRGFGVALFVLDLTDNEKHAALATSFFASLFFWNKKTTSPPHAGLFFQHSFKTLTSLLFLAFFSYCRLPASARNAVFRLGMTSFLSQFPDEAATLKILLIENKPDPEKNLPYASYYPMVGDGSRSRIMLANIVYSKPCNTLVIKGHFRYIVAVFLDHVDEATAKKAIIEDVCKFANFSGRPLFFTKAFGLTLVWEDMT